MRSKPRPKPNEIRAWPDPSLSQEAHLFLRGIQGCQSATGWNLIWFSLSSLGHRSTFLNDSMSNTDSPLALGQSWNGLWNESQGHWLSPQKTWSLNCSKLSNIFCDYFRRIFVNVLFPLTLWSTFMLRFLSWIQKLSSRIYFHLSFAYQSYMPINKIICIFYSILTPLKSSFKLQ